MANTYTQVFIHLVFSVKGRHSIISKEYRNEIEKYISGIVTGKKNKLLSIYCMPDHIHILIGLSPIDSISNLVRDIKVNSSKFISERFPLMFNFSWQRGYGAFSYSKREVHNCVEYILNQERHHKITTFREEYIKFLNDYMIDYNPKYLFEWIE